MKDKKIKSIMKGSTKRSMVVTTVPVSTLLDMIELATARGMQRGAQMVLQEMEEANQTTVAPKPSSPFLGDLTAEEEAEAHEVPGDHDGFNND